jgi:hypothetical protein
LLPLEKFFNEQMEAALRMLHPEEAYWSGYAFGLLSRYCGDRALVTPWHESVLAPSNTAPLALGYREGLRVMTEATGGRVATYPVAGLQGLRDSPGSAKAG